MMAAFQIFIILSIFTNRRGKLIRSDQKDDDEPLIQIF